MQLTQPLHKSLNECPNKVATIFGGRQQSWRELVGRVASLAGGLRELGMARGDRVAMLGMNSDRYLEYVYGVLWGGGVIAPLNVRWSALEIAYALDDCDASVLFVDDAFRPMIEALREHSQSLKTIVYVGESQAPEGTVAYEDLLAKSAPVDDARCGGDDLAVLLYTGGTTGKPKGVMLSHINLLSNIFASMMTIPRDELAVPGLHAAPPFHVAGLGHILQFSLRLGTHVLLPSFEPGKVLEVIEKHGVAETFLVPTMLRMLLDHPDFPKRDLSSLRLLRYGASPMDTALLERALRELPRVRFAQAYGMTELSPTITVLTPEYHTEQGRAAGKLMSAGVPVPLAEVRVVDGNDTPLPPGKVGEIVARGPMVMKGYWNQPAQTAEALRNGWMHTGDAGYIDEDGFLFVVDRIKDMIVTGGENVYSAEVEDAILQFPKVSQCAVIGVPDEKWGERVHAVIVPKPGETVEQDELLAHCRNLIAGFKCPRSMEVRDALPMSGAGKLLKFKLREPYWKNRTRQVG